MDKRTKFRRNIILGSLGLIAMIIVIGGTLLGCFVYQIMVMVDIGNDIETECYVVDISECDCDNENYKDIKFRFDTDEEKNLTVTNEIYCKAYYAVDEKQFCKVNGQTKLEVDKQFPCFYDDDSETVYFSSHDYTVNIIMMILGIILIILEAPLLLGALACVIVGIDGLKKLNKKRAKKNKYVVESLSDVGVDMIEMKEIKSSESKNKKEEV